MSSILTITVPGHSYRLRNPGGRIGRRLATGKPYEHRLLDQIRQRRPRGAALDLGAHVGGHSLYLALVCGLQVHAWEAHAGRYEELQANIALNRKAPHRIVTYPYAAGAETAVGRWRDGRYMALDVGVEAGEVPVRAVDEVMDEPKLSVVKIDIEGMEPQALAGMRGHLARSRPVVYSEVHTEQAHQAQAAVLEPLGYKMISPVQMGSRMECWIWCE